jgi:hypothetical protein
MHALRRSPLTESHRVHTFACVTLVEQLAVALPQPLDALGQRLASLFQLIDRHLVLGLD